MYLSMLRSIKEEREHMKKDIEANEKSKRDAIGKASKLNPKGRFVAAVQEIVAACPKAELAPRPKSKNNIDFVALNASVDAPIGTGQSDEFFLPAGSPSRRRTTSELSAHKQNKWQLKNYLSAGAAQGLQTSTGKGKDSYKGKGKGQLPGKGKGAQLSQFPAPRASKGGEKGKFKSKGRGKAGNQSRKW